MKPSTSFAATVLPPAASVAASDDVGAKLNVTMSAPEALRKSRREIVDVVMVSSSSRDLGRALHRTHDPNVRAAAAQVIRERLADLRFGWLPVRIQECLRLHDHAVDAVAALHGLLVDK